MDQPTTTQPIYSRSVEKRKSGWVRKREKLEAAREELESLRDELQDAVAQRDLVERENRSLRQQIANLNRAH